MRHEFAVERVVKAEVVNVPIAVTYSDEYPGERPTVRIETDKKPNGEYRYIDVYEVDEIPAPGELRGRYFRCKKVMHAKNEQWTMAEQLEHYDVFIDANNQQDTCDCKAGVFAKYCKHMDAFRELIKLGELDATKEAESLVNDQQPEYDEPTLVDDPFEGVVLADGRDPWVDDLEEKLKDEHMSDMIPF